MTSAPPDVYDLGQLFDGTDVEALDIGLQRAGVAAIQAHDPGFDAEVLERQVGETVRVVKHALNAQNAEVERALCGDALWHARQSQRRAEQAAGLRRIVEGVRVDHCMIWGAARNDRHDTISVRVMYEARAGLIGAGGRVVAGAPGLPRPHTEKWFLQRAASATTVPSGTLTMVCPGCRAWLRVTLEGRCTACTAPISSGDLDWVVVRIECEGMFEPPGPRQDWKARQREVQAVQRKLRWKRLSDRLRGRAQPPLPARRPPPVDPDR